jgi:hypothetical protein
VNFDDVLPQAEELPYEDGILPDESLPLEDVGQESE